MNTVETKFVLNGEDRVFNFPPNITLAEALRTLAGLTSLKVGCNRGDCGTCTIIVDGRTARSCNMLAVEAHNTSITTLEGLMKDAGGMTKIQENFLKHNSFQCHFCAPGIIMSTHELLENNPTPDLHEIQDALGGNLCRCTGYTPIIEAIQDLAKENNGGNK